MYLKEIKSHGFKSFADKINIELGHGITGIVGPNGSGKSNIVDAVRWVLGEQSVKSLRGDGAMTDVIFSGSKSRNAQNVASVTLIFDNTDKYLPSLFEEVAIKRRVYRDGTNEYYLNGEKCRLKDITDILLDSGIAKESFNIISQGKIEEILSSKPENRRVIFEEAAGVLKYKKRKEEALRKLDKTHDNMNRVNDIINELEVQIEPLKEQKTKALEYEKANVELTNIEIALIAHDIDLMNTKYQTNKQKIDELNEELITTLTNNTTYETEIEKYKLSLNNIDKEISLLNQKQIEYTSLVEQINGQKKIILERKQYEVDDVKLHNNIIILKEQELQLINDINNVDNKLTSLKKDLEQSEIDISKFNKQLSDEQLNKRVVDNNISDKLRKQVFIQNKIDSLRDSIENNSSLPSGVKNVINNPKLQGIHNTIGNVIEINIGYEIAISIALGSAVNYVIVDNEKNAKEAINYLKNYNLGRATFFPLNIITPKGIDVETMTILEKISGFIDVASNLVATNPIYNNIIKNQLGNVIVASNLDDANIISKAIKYRYRVVTVNGELLHVGGSVTGGNIYQSKNIISEKQDLDKYMKALNDNINDIKLLEEKINNYDELVRSIEDKIYLLSKDKLIIENDLANKQSDLELLNNRIKTVRQDIVGTDNVINQNLSKEEETVLEKYYSAVQELDNVKHNLEQSYKEKENINENLEQYEFSLKKESGIINNKNKEIKDLEIEVNRMDVKLDTMLNTLNETYNITFEKANRDYHLEIEEDTARIKVVNLKRQIKELGVINLGAIAEYDRISERYEFLIKQKSDLDAAENTLLEIINEMDSIMIEEFQKTFDLIKTNFQITFKELFKGGNAELKLTEPDNILETGIDIIASPPGKKLTSISLLSGGEKTFTAISLLFAILKSRPVPFCILDEVEAALDEVNVASFGEYLTSLKQKTQFIMITHKKKTMEFADVLYGITMQESGVSKLVSVKLEEIK
ncbi:MAG: AAA family ATPase [Bacilli bacterium]|nr:AAA family ATPase [Bacilli bacterium]